MDLENQTINLGNNVIPNVEPLNNMITGQVNNVNAPVNIIDMSNNLNTTQEVISVSQQQADIQAAAQVVTPSTTSGIIATTNVQQVSNNVVENNVTLTEENIVNRPEGTPVVQQPQFTMYDTFTVNAEMFKSMISIAKKAATCEPNLVPSTIFDIIFDNEYLKVISSNGNDVLVQTNKTVGFRNTKHFNVRADFFNDLISKISCNTITFNFDDEGKYIELITDDNSSYKIQESFDRNTGGIVILEKPEGSIQPGDIEIDIDGVQFKQILQSVSTMRCPFKVAKYLSGIYCSDRIYSTDSENMLGLKNLPQLVDHPFYINNEFVELLLTLDLSSNSKIVLRPSKDEPNLIEYIILMDEKLCVYGPCNLEFTKKFPVPIIQQYMTSELTSKFTIERSKLENVLKIADLFVEPTVDKECCIFTPNMEQGVLEVKSINGRAHQYITIQGLNNTLNVFHLKIRDFLKILSNCSSDTITFEVDGQNYANIRIIDNDCTLIMSIQNF